MSFPRFLSNFLLLLLTATIVICLDTGLPSLSLSHTLAQTPSNASASGQSLADLASELSNAADAEYVEGDFVASEALYRRALEAYCADSKLSENSTPNRRLLSLYYSPTNVEDVREGCFHLLDEAHSIEAVERYRASDLPESPSRLYSYYNLYNLPLAMASTFRNYGDAYTMRREYAEAMKFYKASANIFQYQNDLDKLDAFVSSSGRSAARSRVCPEYRNFSEFSESLYKLGGSLFDIYKRLEEDSSDKALVLKLSEELANMIIQRLGVFSYESAVNTATYVNSDAATAISSYERVLAGNDSVQFTIGAYAGVAPSTPGADHLNEQRIDSAQRIVRQLTRSAQASACIIDNLPPELESRISGLLQLVLIEKGEWDRALVIGDAGRTFEVDKFIAYNLEQVQGGVEGNLVKELTSVTATIQDVSQVAIQQNAFIINYSIISDGDLLIWIFSPDGSFVLKKIICSQLLSDVQVDESETQYSYQCSAKLQKLIQPQSREWGRGQLISRIEPLRDEQGEETYFSKENLKRLYQILIEPIADLLPQDPNQDLIFVPHGPIFFAPFAALIDGSDRYLIDSHTIRSAPNLRTLILNHQKQKNRFFDLRKALVVGNPDMPKIGENSEQLRNLPWAGLEAVNIAAFLRQNGFETTRLLGNQATKSRVDQLMTDASIVHLATHSIIDGDIAQEASPLTVSGQIALSPSNDSNGWLTALELIRAKLSKVDLIVLSSCDSASGKLIPGGIIGLPFSLNLAGVSNVLGSLWSVYDSDATVALMENFYNYLFDESRGTDFSQALRQAMISTRDFVDEDGIKPYADPKYWSGFVLTGSSQ